LLGMIKAAGQDFLERFRNGKWQEALVGLRDQWGRIFSNTYTRSHRMGELYEEELYAKVQDGHQAAQPRRMPDLLIKPQGHDGFSPRFSNWRRRAKVPILLLNTTSLNSGHNWHFTASWMGEPPGLLGAEVDSNERYRRLYYHQASTETLQNYRLGYAVAASACVPGLFEPLAIDGLYPDRTVCLVDGDVHDNQGVVSLLDEWCSLILCSDASGQLKDEPKPSDKLLSVLLNSGDIQGARVRDTEYRDLKSREDSRALQGLFFIHLKKDPPIPLVDWLNCDDPTPKPKAVSTMAPYGIDIDVQRQLAAIRTDLDSLTEVEAYALMLSSYLMTTQEFQELQRLHEKNGEPGTWGRLCTSPGCTGMSP
ncbi:MAG TPA: patatin family protein, partial [Gammaproteobacteria bacterium]|nr:patatin family protein [Gammaproteobacteria bacterium]